MPEARPKSNRDELLAQIPADDCPEEFDVGLPVGRAIWWDDGNGEDIQPLEDRKS